MAHYKWHPVSCRVRLGCGRPRSDNYSPDNSIPLGFKEANYAFPTRSFIRSENEFQGKWLEYRNTQFISLSDAISNMQEIIEKRPTASKWIREIELGTLFIPSRYTAAHIDYKKNVVHHCNFCNITQETLDCWAQYLPSPIEHKVITPVDISTVFR